jgi:hypothetical protein
LEKEKTQQEALTATQNALEEAKRELRAMQYELQQRSAVENQIRQVPFLFFLRFTFLVSPEEKNRFKRLHR